jgi:hypothetical protein
MGNLDKIWTQMGTFVVAAIREIIGLSFVAGYYFAHTEIGKPVPEDLKDATMVRLFQELDETGGADHLVKEFWRLLPAVMKDAEDSCNASELNDIMIIRGDGKKTAH